MLQAPYKWRSSVLLLASVFIGQAQICYADSDKWLTQDIPGCALGCVKVFIQDELPTGSCSGGTSLSCLCRTNSTSGLTLGEAGLACTIGSCDSDMVSNSSSLVYGICDGVYGALPETHSTITATRVATVTETLSATSTSTSTSLSLSTSTSLTRTAHSTIVSSTHRILPSITTFSTSTGSSLTTSVGSLVTASSSPTAHASSSLSTPAVIGVSVASGVSGLFLVSVAVILCGRRIKRRRLDGKNREIFEIGGDMSEPPEFADDFPPNPGPAPDDDGFSHVRIGPNFQQFPSQPVARNGPLLIVTEGHNKETNGHAFSPPMEYDGSPQSQSSQHTLSLLLPEKPTYGLFPQPLKVIRQAPRPTSDATIFDEDEEQLKSIFGPPLDQSRLPTRKAPDGTQNRQQGTQPFGLPADPRAMLYAAQKALKQNSFNVGAQVYKWETPDDVKIPPAPPPKTDDGVGRAVTGYSMASVGSGSSSAHSSIGNSRLQRNFSRLGGRSRSIRGLSGGSASLHTSFDTLDVDENNTDRQLELPTQLSPVREAITKEEIQPAVQSPVKYPPMPRSAAVAPAAEVVAAPRAGGLYGNKPETSRLGEHSTATAGPRSPSLQGLINIPLFIDTSSRSRSSSPGSLLAKRRGEKMAERMESAFRSEIENKSTPGNLARGRPRWKVVKNDSPSGAVSVARSNTPKTPRVDELKTPQKHNITPTRRGEDLYLSVD